MGHNIASAVGALIMTLVSLLVVALVVWAGLVTNGKAWAVALILVVAAAVFSLWYNWLNR